MSPTHRPSFSIAMPTSPVFLAADADQMPHTPEARQQSCQSTAEPPPPPRPVPFKVKRKRPSAQFNLHHLDTSVIPTIEMSEAPSQLSSPTFQHSVSARFLSPIMSATHSRTLTPPTTPAPKLYPSFSQLESPADEWDMINNRKPTFQRANSVCSSFSDSSISSCGSSAFSAPINGYDSPLSEANDPFMDDDPPKQARILQSPMRQDAAPKNKRVKTRRDVRWTQQMDDHLWMTFSAYLSDPTLTPFKMLPGSTPPMGVCDQVATKAKRTWRARKAGPSTPGAMDMLFDSHDHIQLDGSPDTIRPTSLQISQSKWPKNAATRRRLRELCARRPSISAHYQRMLRTRSPSPFETSSPGTQQPEPTSFSGIDMIMSLVTSTAPSMQPNGPLAQLTSQVATPQPPPTPKPRRLSRPARPEGWFDRIPRSKAHQKSASLQSELNLNLEAAASQGASSLASPFDGDSSSSRTHLLHSMANTRSLGRTEFNGKSLDSPLEFRTGAPTDRRSRKRRFRSDEEKPRRGALEDVFGPPSAESDVGRSRGFTVGAICATDNLTKMFTPRLPTFDQPMAEAPTMAELGSRSAPRRLAEPVPRLGSPFMETPPPCRQHNTFPRTSLLPSAGDQEPFHQRLVQLVAEHHNGGASSR
ncbi:uncharacterized protein RCC_00257 [Ramularia collo-cygni]|uniref:Uncharacterized protein n=1 Tax=Ramularia collo-cygni TaxID=112498 RepID=A0A2D3ULA5_9PEZI|nr:uncharacterized protein RCC_00257 [Ramularia collo-cygni]CZT14282.1 uncharacterized protein RCC_00257 [Ramularia collo-cygni]